MQLTRLEDTTCDGLTPTLALYLDLHANPELSGQESRTAGVLAASLREAGYEVSTAIGGHGVVGVLRNGPGPVVVLRCELDALPVSERTGLVYSADPASGVMHACGHDVHVACAAGAAALLSKYRDGWRGMVAVLGQPAEETLSGAAAMLADGVYDRCGRPDVLLAQHTAPFPAGMIGHAGASGQVTAASLTLSILMHGKGGHAGLPHLAANPITAAAALVGDIHDLGAAWPTPLVAVAASIHAGERPNVIPGQALLGVSLRAADLAGLDSAQRAIERLAQERCAAASCPRPPEIARAAVSPAGVNDPGAAALVRASHVRAFGPHRVTDVPPSGATEDFPLLAALAPGGPVPSVYWALGCVGHRDWAAAPGTGAAQKIAALPANHSAEFAPDPVPTIRTGTAALAAAALAFLSPDAAGTRTGTAAPPAPQSVRLSEGNPR
jgi:hippurate hydrolase